MLAGWQLSMHWTSLAIGTFAMRHEIPFDGLDDAQSTVRGSDLLRAMASLIMRVISMMSGTFTTGAAPRAALQATKGKQT